MGRTIYPTFGEFLWNTQREWDNNRAHWTSLGLATQTTYEAMAKALIAEYERRKAEGDGYIVTSIERPQGSGGESDG